MQVKTTEEDGEQGPKVGADELSAGRPAALWTKRRVCCRCGRRSAACLLRLLVEVGGETDATALRCRRVHELSDGREHGGDGIVVRGKLLLDACFELIECVDRSYLDNNISYQDRKSTLRILILWAVTLPRIGLKEFMRFAGIRFGANLLADFLAGLARHLRASQSRVLHQIDEALRIHGLQQVSMHIQVMDLGGHLIHR